MNRNGSSLFFFLKGQVTYICEIGNVGAETSGKGQQVGPLRSSLVSSMKLTSKILAHGDPASYELGTLTDLHRRLCFRVVVRGPGLLACGAASSCVLT